MATLALVGLDPGIVDTGGVRIELDLDNKTVEIESRVYRRVTERSGNSIVVDPGFLQSLRHWAMIGVPGPLHIFLEGYRNRGRNPRQDQQMSMLVQEIHGSLPGSIIVDNTGVKNVVKQPLLGMLDLDTWKVPTHHADLASAARILLKGGFQDEELNKILSDWIRDCLEGAPWTLTKSHRS